MNTEETIQILDMLDAGWAHKPLPEMTRKLWGMDLAKFAADDVFRVVSHLSRTSEFRPSLATMLKALVVPAGGETSSEAFAAVWAETGRKGRGGKPDISERAAKAVRLLGGWEIVCMTWQRDSIHFHKRDFCKEFDELEARDNHAAVVSLDARRTLEGGPVAVGELLGGSS